MATRMVRRGPDSSGVWQSGDGCASLAHRRLAILDLSEAGHQPMVSPDARSVLVYNGELYNHAALRDELEQAGHVFRGTSDTEVVLAALEAWGRDALGRFNGMFALAWWDDARRSLLLARDHAGIKPLYYAIQPGGAAFGFASTLEALLDIPWIDPRAVDPDALRDLLALAHIPAPGSLVAHTRQLEPGGYLERQADGTVTTGTWWRPEGDGWGGHEGEVDLDQLDALLHQVVARQRMADVPLGSFLSGGIDSALVTAVARAQTDASFQTFTITNPGWGQDEGADAARYAEHLDVRAHMLQGTDASDDAAWSAASEAQYEPFGDFSMLPTLQVCEAAGRQVTVILSGDGGDELFYGYARPFSLLKAGRRFRWSQGARRLRYLLGRVRLAPAVSSVITHADPASYYRSVNTRMAPAWLTRVAPGLDPALAGAGVYRDRGAREPDELARFARAAEWGGQLQRCLKKVDMASMHHSLEVRVPLLDRDIVEFAFSLAPDTLVRSGEQKKPLRDLLARYVPSSSLPTTKRGFAVPLADWLRTSLRPTMERLLCEEPLWPDGLIDPAAVRALVAEHLAGQADHKWGLYTLMSLQAWARRVVA